MVAADGQVYAGLDDAADQEGLGGAVDDYGDVAGVGDLYYPL